MNENTRPLIVLSPEGIPMDRQEATQPQLAPRLSTLDGKTIGLIDDGFAGSEEYVRGVGDLLVGSHADVTVRYWRKPTLARAAPIPLIEEAGLACDAVIVGIAA